MDKQIKYLLGILILLLISAYFLSLLGGLPQYFKGDIIAFLEERFSGEISFSSISLWPLNRLRLQSFSFEDQNGNKFKVDQLNLDYELNFGDFNKIFEVKFIEAKRAEIVITEEFFAVDSDNEAIALNSELANNENNNFRLSNFDLPGFMAGININILDSKLLIQNNNYDLEFDNLNLGLNANTDKDYQLNLSTAVLINDLNYNDFTMNKLSVENIDLQLQRENKEAELYFKTQSFSVQTLLEILPENNYSYQGLNLALNTVNGQFKTKGRVKIDDSEIKKYNTEINFSELNFRADYQKSGQQEKFDFNFNDLNFIISGPEFNLAAVDNNFTLDNNQLQFSLKVDRDFQYQLRLSAEEFKYNYQFFNPQFKNGDFDFDLNLKGTRGKVNQAQAEVEAENISSQYSDISKFNFVIKYSDDEIFVEEAELELDDNSGLALQASYNFQNKNYLFSAKAQKMKISDNLISLLEENNLGDNYLEQLRAVENDRLDFNVDAAGHYSHSKGISAAGDLSFNFDIENRDNNFSIESEFWYVDNRLFFNSLKLFSDFAYLDLVGEIDFTEKELDLRYAAKNFEPAVLNKNLNLEIDFLNDINPTIKYAEGRIADSFTNPTITMDLNLDELAYQNYAVNNINIKAVYEDDNLELTEVSAAVNQALLRANGEIKNLSTAPSMDLKIESQNLYFQDLAQSFNFKLPLSGEVDIEANLKGSITDYNFDATLNTSNTVVSYQNQEFELTNLSSTIKKEDENFEIVDFSFKQQNLSFKATGIYNLDSGFDLSYQLDGIELQDYLRDYPQIAGKASGSLSLAGNLRGKLEKIIFNFELAAKNLSYDGIEFAIKENEFKLNLQKQRLAINSFDFSIGSGQYQFNGEIFDLFTLPRSELNLKLIEVPTEEYFQKYLGLHPFAKELILRGETQIQSEGLDYNAALNIDGYLDQSEQSSLNLNGEIGREINLSFEAADLPLDISATQYDINLDTTANLNFSGNLSGSLETPVLNSTHSLDSIEINNTAVQSVKGDILLESKRRISASETITLRKGGNLDIDGSYSFSEDDLNLSSKLQALPLSFVLSFLGDRVSGDGQLNGNFRAEGSLDSPQLSGNLEMAGNSLEVGIWNPIENYRSEIELKNDQALIREMRGEFGDGDFQIGGLLNLFDRENFWDLSLTGEQLYLDYGSLEGNFDSDLTFSGSLSNPLLAGETEIYDFVIGIPLEQPAEGQIGEVGFIPRIDMEILLGDNNRVKNPNMNVLIENGNLGINFNQHRQNSLMMEGRLRSSEGRFNYYNSRFNLNRAEVLFTPVDEGDIPHLQANATTYASGREIYINVNGPANNMRINLSSSPEMTEEKIINILSSRGALGSAIIGGEDIGVQQIILQELIRIVNGFLQEDVIGDIESNVKSAFALDRIEIDAFQYGLEREFAIYLGKNLSDRFYVEFASFFGEETREQELTFQYNLTEITNIKGTYFGDQEYRITLETEIEF